SCRLLPNSFGAGVFIAIFRKLFTKPAATILAGFHFEIGEDLEVSSRFEMMNLVLALGQNRQRWRLHPSNWRQLEPTGFVVERSQGARAVDSHQPVAFRSANSCFGQRNHLLV